MYLLFNSCEPIFQLEQENENFTENTRTPYSYYDYSEDTGIYNISVEMPGISKDVLEISATDHSLTIRTKSEENTDINTLRYFRRFNFNTKIDPKSITAVFKDGLLGLKVKKDFPSPIEVKIN